MMRRIAPAWIAAVVLMGAGCIQAPVVPPLGLVYTGTTAPLDTELRRTELGSRRGQASSYAILGLVSWGDAGVAAAAAQGGLSTIAHADYTYTNWAVGVYQRFTTIVYGD